MKIELRGIDKLNKGLNDLAKLEAAKRIVKQSGAELQQKAMRNAPVDTGTLKRSIRLELKDGGMTAEVRATAEYAPYVEFGTRFMYPRPYMAIAFEEVYRSFKQKMDALVK